jgi:hypothetical protein
MITNVPGAAGTTAQQRLVYQGTAPAGGVSIVGGIVIPDSLDPSASGFTAAIGTVITSVSGLLAWKKWGAVDTNWIALHPTKGTTVAPSTNLDIPLYCESAGGFRLVLENIDVTSAVGNPTIRLRVNGADVADANSLFWSVRWTGAAWFTTDIVYAGSMFLGGVGSYLTVGEYCRATIECQLPQIAIGRRRLSTDSVRRLGTAAQAIVPLHMDSYPANGAELTSIGIAVTGGTAQLATGISWRLERLP